MPSNHSIPVAVYRTSPGASLAGADWVRGGDPWLAERLSPVGKNFPRTPAMRAGLFSIRWIDGQYVVTHAVTEPPRQNVVLRAARIEPDALWRWIVPLCQCLKGAPAPFLEGNAAVTIQEAPDSNPAVSLRYIFGMLSGWGPIGPEAQVSVLYTGESVPLDLHLRMAAAVAQFLEPRSSVAVLLDSAREPEERSFVNLGWRAFVGPSSVGTGLPRKEVSPFEGLVRGVRVVDLFPSAQSILDGLFEHWNLDGPTKKWDERIQLPPALIPAHLLSEEEWARRLAGYIAKSGDPSARNWDYDCVWSASPPLIHRCIQLCNLESSMGLDRTIRNRFLNEKCKISIEQIRTES